MNEQETGVSTLARGPLTVLKRRKFALILLAIIVVLIVLVVRNIHKDAQPGAQGRIGRNGGPGNFNQSVAVSVARVTTGDLPIRIPALGTITPLATVTVRTQISGQLQKIGFVEGQVVKQGDFLAQIDPRPYEAVLAQDKGNLRKDQSLLADAKLALKRFEELIREDSVAQQQLDTQRALVEQYEGTIEADQAQLKTAQLNLSYTHIVAPVSGRIGLRQVDVGNYVTPGDANGLAVVTQLQPITALFSIPEDYVSPIMQKLLDKVPLTVEAFDRSNANKLAAGKLLTADNQIDATTGTIRLRALFDNKDNKLFPNQFVNIQLLLDVLHEQKLLPAAAVHRGAPNGVTSTFVYLINPDSTAAVKPVKIGAADGEIVAVTSGLAEGDIVVIEGGDRLRDGAQVQLPADTPVHNGSTDKAPSPALRKGGANGGRRTGRFGGLRPQ